MNRTEPSYGLIGLASMRNLDTAEAPASAIDSRCPDCLGVDRSKALLDSAGHPGWPIWRSMSGSHRRESVSVGECFIAPERRQHTRRVIDADTLSVQC